MILSLTQRRSTRKLAMDSWCSKENARRPGKSGRPLLKPRRFSKQSPMSMSARVSQLSISLPSCRIYAFCVFRTERPCPGCLLRSTSRPRTDFAEARHSVVLARLPIQLETLWTELSCSVPMTLRNVLRPDLPSSRNISTHGMCSDDPLMTLQHDRVAMLPVLRCALWCLAEFQ